MNTVLLLIILILVMATVFKLTKKYSPRKRKISTKDSAQDVVDAADRETFQNEYDLPMIEKSIDNEYDDAIDVDAIEESAYTTHIPEQDNSTPVEKECCSSSNTIEDDNTFTF